jgi:RimJ/RimL family protein N-acetyltransferase
MKPICIGKNITLREIQTTDAEFVLGLRTDPNKNKHLSPTLNDLERQRKFISDYFNSTTDFYFIISDHALRPIGTVRLYDVQGNSFCWGSWILASDAPTSAAIESALLLYDFAFFSLHYKGAHFDVRKANSKVVDFHKRFGARVVREDDLNFYFEYDLESYLQTRTKYRRYLP